MSKTNDVKPMCKFRVIRGNENIPRGSTFEIFENGAIRQMHKGVELELWESGRPDLVLTVDAALETLRVWRDDLQACGFNIVGSEPEVVQ